MGKKMGSFGGNGALMVDCRGEWNEVWRRMNEDGWVEENERGVD
jgi:hypothetical protein